MMDGLTASLSMRTGRGGSKVVASKRKPEAERRKRQRRYQRLRPQIDALYDELHRQYPQTFFRDPEKIHPLKIGIDHDLRERIEAPKRVLHYCMQRYATRPAYLRALIAQKPRLDLAGQAVGTVTDDERESAQERLSSKGSRRRPKISRSRQAGEERVPPHTSPTPPAGAITPEASQSHPVPNDTPTPHPAAISPQRRLPANWQRILTYLSRADGPQRPVDIGLALEMKNPGGILRRMRERGLVQQMKRGLYEAAEKAEQEGET
jgi:sRNA-binding protein